MKIGYYIVDPGLGIPEIALDLNTQVRCLFFLKEKMNQIISIPSGVFFDVIKVQYTGSGSPALGMYSETVIGTGEKMTTLSLLIEESLEAYIKSLGIDELVQLSSKESVSWQDIVESSALRTSELSKR